MEQEKHLTEPYNRKTLTRASARHLRRKRLKDARRAEKQQQSLQIVNGVNDDKGKETNGDVRKESDGVTRNAEEVARSDAKSIQKPDDVFLNLVLQRPGIEDSLRFESLTQYGLCNDYIEIDRALERECQKLKQADLAKEQRLFQQHLFKYLESPKYYCESTPLPPSTNGEKKRKHATKISSNSNATQEDSPENTPTSPVSLISNTDLSSDCPTIASWKSGAAKSGKDVLSLDDLMEFVSCTSSVRNDICVASDQQTDVADCGANHTLVNVENENSITTIDAQSDLINIVQCEDRKTSRKLVSPTNMADKKSNPSEKIKEQRKREAKSSKVVKNTDSDVKNESPDTCKSPKKNTESKSVMTIETQSAQLVPEVKSKSKHDAEQNDIHTDAIEHVSPRNNKTNTSPEKAVFSTEVAEEKSSLPEKTREEIKTEREAKKFAKAAAKAKAKTKTKETTESTKNNVQNERPTTSHMTLNKSGEVNVTVNAQMSQSAKAAEEDFEKRAIQHSTVHSSIMQTPNMDVHQNCMVTENKNDSISKTELRAKRRATQEAQRAAKQERMTKQQKLPDKQQQSIEQQQRSSAVNFTERPNAVPTQPPAKSMKTKDEHQVNLFKQLYLERELAAVKVNLNSNIHPAIVRLGVQYARKMIVGSNARCVSLLCAVKVMIEDFEKPSQADFIRSLEANLQESMVYLHHCRPVAVSMQNAIRYLKLHMTQFSPNTKKSDEELKKELAVGIDTYIKEQIMLADKAISITIKTKISNGDVILTYGYSSLIQMILLEAHKSNKEFSVIVVDGRPWLEGRQLLEHLVKRGIDCSYIMINAVSYVMPRVSKVFLGAHAILANGAVMSRVGTAQIALMAKAFNVPVLVACETHKSCERVQTDSIVYNELGDADELVNTYENSCKKSSLINWRSRKTLNLLNITYDVTPADLVTAVVTELAILPCTSAPVILRIKPSEF